MITIDTYITILFSIIITASLSAFITIITQNLTSINKRNMIIIVSLITITLIIAITVIYFFDNLINKISFLKLSASNIIDVMHFPFNKPEFSDHIYKKLYYISMSIYLFTNAFFELIVCLLVREIIYRKANIKTIIKIFFKLTGKVILSFIIYLYPYTWGSYIVCNLLFYNVPLWGSYIIQINFTLIFTFIEMLLIYITSFIKNKKHL